MTVSLTPHPYDIHLARAYTGVSEYKIHCAIKSRTKTANRRAFKAGIQSRLYRIEVLRLLNAAEWRCVYTGERPKSYKELTLDHVEPLSIGTNTIWNILPALAHINNLKGNKPLHQWLDEIDTSIDEFNARRMMIYQRWLSLMFSSYLKGI